jgi:hypothetical protein
MSSTPISGSFSGTQTASNNGLGSVKVTFEVLRAKKLPQSEDEALACSSSVRLSVLKTNLGPGPVATFASYTTPVQKANNNPFYNETIEIPLSPLIEQVWLWLEVIESARQSSPQTILHARVAVPCATSTTGKGVELTLPLLAENPATAEAKFTAAEAAAAGKADAPSLGVRFKVAVAKPPKKEVDVNADVVFELPVELSGSHKLIPADAVYSWVHLLFDDKWKELFTELAVDQWRSAPTLAGNAMASPRRGSTTGGDLPPRKGSVAPQKSPRNEAGGGKSGGGGGAGKTIGDLIVNQWACRRTHQVICRLRMAAERFGRGQPSVVFTLEDEQATKRIWSERAAVRMTLVKRSFDNFSGNDRLRGMLDRLWMLMAMGIPAEGAQPQISIDQRMKLQQAQFTAQHAEILQACLLSRLCPSLPFSQCEAIAKEDQETKLPPPPPPLPRQANVAVLPSQDPKMHPQLCFVDVIVSFVAKVADTLTDAEFAQLLEAFMPAVKEAHYKSKAASGSAAGVESAGGPAPPKSGKKGARQGSAEKKSEAPSSLAPK